MRIPQIVCDNITIEYIKDYIKRNNLGIRLTQNKPELIVAINLAIANHEISSNQLKDFCMNAYKYGNSNYMVTSIFEITSQSALASELNLKQSLTSNSESIANFNDFLSLDSANIYRDHLIYQNISFNDEKRLFERCYVNTITKAINNADGTQDINTTQEFVWIELDILNKKFNLKFSSGMIGNHLQEAHTVRRIYNRYQDKINQLFGIVTVSAINEERTLYNIFKSMTEKSEEPFRDIVSKVEEEILEFYESISTKIGYDVGREYIEVPKRISRILERGLISQDFSKYEEFFEGKLGIVKRIVFYDSTGATVSAHVKDMNQNINEYDIFFDTRETLEKQNSLKKLWVNWFYPLSETRRKILKFKFEVYPDYYVTQYLSGYILEEEAKYVLSKFREFEV